MQKSFLHIGAMTLCGLVGQSLSQTTAIAAPLGETTGYFEVDYDRLGNANATQNGVEDIIYTAPFTWAPNDQSSTYTAFCVQPDVAIFDGDTYTFTAWRPQDFFNQSTGTLLEDFWAAYYSDDFDTETATAFQLGIWHLVTEGDLTATGSAWDLAVTWLENIPTGLAASVGLQMIILENPDYQNLITYASALSPAAVPTPAAAGLALMGLGGLAMRRTRQN